ncbi:MAG: hypothetical protein U1F36_07215 [Planctomycetota bacterium]
MIGLVSIQGGGMRAPPSVQEGGRIEIDVQSGASHVLLIVPGVGRVKVGVVGGVAEYQLPPGVRGGVIIFISDMKLPNPSATTVQVVGNQ